MLSKWNPFLVKDHHVFIKCWASGTLSKNMNMECLAAGQGNFTFFKTAPSTNLLSFELFDFFSTFESPFTKCCNCASSTSLLQYYVEFCKNWLFFYCLTYLVDLQMKQILWWTFFIDFGYDNWWQAEACNLLLVGVVEVNALAQRVLRQFTQWSWIEHPTFRLCSRRWTSTTQVHCTDFVWRSSRCTSSSYSKNSTEIPFTNIWSYFEGRRSSNTVWFLWNVT